MKENKSKTLYHTKGVYPKDDEFEETTIKKVQKYENGWEILREDGWSFHVPLKSQVVPKIGMPIRFYGKGIGSPVRGLFIDGLKVFYRTKKQQEIYQKKEIYGKDAKEWLKRWDEGKIVWSIEMGGLGPGYEQALQIAAVEVLRYFIESKFKKMIHDQKVHDLYDQFKEHKIIKSLGLSGGQWGAAVYIARLLYSLGPIKIMTDPAYTNNKIQISKYFPNPYDKGKDE